jgi:hypothetical protein
LLKQIDAAMLEANIVFQNSRVNARVHLAQATEINYVESGSVSNDLARLTNPGNGILAQGHRLRDQVNADLVCMITETGSDWWFYGLQGPSAENAFSIIRRPYLTGSYYFPVTLSFNFGCQLERSSADSIGAFPYAYGYSFWGNGTFYSTVEAFSGQRIPYFSNPDILFQGVPIGVPAGLVNAANNALVINQTAPIVAAFRGSASVTQPPIVSLITPSTAEKFRAGTNVSLQVMATDSNGKIIRVYYYAGTNWVASSQTLPFNAIWNHVPMGEYSLFAVATDNAGAPPFPTRFKSPWFPPMTILPHAPGSWAQPASCMPITPSLRPKLASLIMLAFPPPIRFGGLIPPQPTAWWWLMLRPAAFRLRWMSIREMR